MAILADAFNTSLHRCSIDTQSSWYILICWLADGDISWYVQYFLHRRSIDIVASTESMVHASLMFISPAPLIARPKRPLIHSCIFVNRCADVSCNSCISGAEPKVSIGNYRPCADAQKSWCILICCLTDGKLSWRIQYVFASMFNR